jgi:potassium-transporting ATPase ATP-binding subunit
LWRQSAIDAVNKLDPRAQIRNPVMFVVWLGALVTAALTIDPGLFGPSSASAAYNGVVTVILLLTVWFANFAEALAEGRGKAKAAWRRVLTSGEIEQVPATALRKEDVVRVELAYGITNNNAAFGALTVRASANPGESFLDRMIHLVERAKRQKTPTEMALTALLAILTLIFLIAVAAMAPVAHRSWSE